MSYGIVQKFCSLNYKIHLALSLVIRFLFIAYGEYHDKISTVPYTDVDYRVFTDAARHVINNKSPYDRHTYRYTPLVAILVIPNICVHPCWGKILFCLVDIVNAILIRSIVKTALRDYGTYKEKFKVDGSGMTQNYPSVTGKNKKKSKHPKSLKSIKPEQRCNSDHDATCNISMLSWLYNPMTVAIGTRGNCDSVAVFLVLATLYFLQCKRQFFIAGLVHGISVHFRLYPIIYSLAFFMHLSEFSFYSTEDRRKFKDTNGVANTAQSIDPNHKNVRGDLEHRSIFQKKYLLYLVPNQNQIRLVTGCFISLTCLTGIFYYLYGYKFLYETYIYHLIRKDTRHNFSLYFYLQYLTAWVRNVGLWQKVLTVLPQLVLLLVLSVRYGLNRFSINFAVLTQTMVIVTYNSVLTSQYFVWIMAVLPLCLWQIRISIKSALFLLGIWLAAQGAWLLPAYCLEFRGQNTFLFIWIQGVSFFCANIAILGRLIMNFTAMKEKEQ